MNAVQRNNLMMEYNTYLLQLEEYRYKAMTSAPHYQHLYIIQAQAFEWFLDEWCADHGITPRHVDGWYW